MVETASIPAVASDVPTERCQEAENPDPCALVIFGITGDLARRKLIPALYHLEEVGALPRGLYIVGVSRSVEGDPALRDALEESTRRFYRSSVDPERWARFAQRLHGVAGDATDPETYGRLRSRLAQLDRARSGSEDWADAGNRLYYLAVAPPIFPSVLRQLSQAGGFHPTGTGSPWARVIVEKPFGRDLETARGLNELVSEVLREDQVYRIDHYLGKETVQNILAFRFANAIFEPLWSREHIDHIQITAAEDLEVAGRGAFYDDAGVVRDIIQNHLLQIMALTLMEPPISLAADDVRDEKVKIIRSLRPLDRERDVVLAQYEGYADVAGVARGSRTPTFAALRLGVESWRWSGVPIFLRAGKALAARKTEVAVVFKSLPSHLFGVTGALRQPNLLVLRIQPDEGISLRFASKVPGEDVEIGQVLMDFSYASGFDRRPGEAYERLLLDAMRGDATLFARRDEVEEAWKVVDPLLDDWARAETPVPQYTPGGQGPGEVAALMQAHSFGWREIK